MNSVEDLDVFKLAHQLALKTYSATKDIPERRTIQLGRSNPKSRRFGGHESDGRGHAAGQQGISAIRRHRPRIRRRGLLPTAARRDLKYISNDTYQELRTGYDRVIQMLSRLSQSLKRTTTTITLVLHTCTAILPTRSRRLSDTHIGLDPITITVTLLNDHELRTRLFPRLTVTVVLCHVHGLSPTHEHGLSPTHEHGLSPITITPLSRHEHDIYVIKIAFPKPAESSRLRKI